jgi:hypothetical protein
MPAPGQASLEMQRSDLALHRMLELVGNSPDAIERVLSRVYLIGHFM